MYWNLWLLVRYSAACKMEGRDDSASWFVWEKQKNTGRVAATENKIFFTKEKVDSKNICKYMKKIYANQQITAYFVP